jgi:OmpA-OmpF porin, OOP family
MMKHAIHPSFLILLCCCLPALAAAENRPTTPADLAQIERLDRQVEKLGFGPLGPDHYALSKARAWLALALDEYYETERSGIVQEATAQAAAILDGLAHAPAYDASATPLPYASENVRPDLWEQAAAMRRHAEFACAGRRVAELEVQLVWTGHEKWESGWSHAEPYARIAENIAYEAQRDIDACALKRVQKAAPASVSAVSTPTVERIVVEKRTLATDSLFAFDQSGIEHLVQGGRQKLDALADELKTWKSLERIDLSGHTDRLGSERYNQGLSESRAEQIRQYLVRRGLPLNLIEARGLGESEPVVQCTIQRSRSALIECLQPNRRVELVIQGVPQ